MKTSNGGCRCGRCFELRGNGRSVMRTSARGNKNYGLSEPTDQRKAIATRDRQDLMPSVCAEGHEQARLAQ